MTFVQCSDLQLILLTIFVIFLIVLMEQIAEYFYFKKDSSSMKIKIVSARSYQIQHRENLMGEMWHEVPLVNSSITASDPSFCVDGHPKSEETPRGFTGTFLVIDDKEAHYEAQMLARTVLPVFSKSMLPITLPHTPFQLRDSYTKLYRNPHNFFYSAMGNIYSSSFFRKKSEEEEQLFEKLETALNLGNLRNIRFRSQLFHRWLKSK